MWVEVEDVEARWVSADEKKADTAVIQAWINDAEQVVSYEFPDLQDRIDDGDMPVERVKLVVCSMVLRVLRNPENVRSRNTGPFGVTYAGDTPGGLWLTDEERSLLSTAAGTGKAFTITPAPPTDYTGPLPSWAPWSTYLPEVERRRFPW